MISGHGQPLTLELSQRELTTGLMVFDCRGFEPVDFSFSEGWKAESVSKSAICSFSSLFALLILLLHLTRTFFIACHPVYTCSAPSAPAEL